jgi:uncharacterized protein
MITSKYNIIEKLKHPVDNFGYILVNSLTGSMDFITEEIKQEIEKNELNGAETTEYLVERGYACKNEKEEFEKIKILSDYTYKKSKNKVPKVILLLTYLCNYNCEYCYQKNLRREKRYITEQQINTIFNYLEDNNVHEIDLIGGEPLLDNEISFSLVTSILKFSTEKKIKVKIITNGSNLTKYVPVFRNYPCIKFVQVTIDGPDEYEKNCRNNLRIYKGIKLALENNIRVAARVNISSENTEFLHKIYNSFLEWGFLNYTKMFYSYISPIHNHCCEKVEEIIHETEILKSYLQEKNKGSLSFFSDKNFIITEYMKSVFETKKANTPRFYRCEANTNQIVFDPYGMIYPCIEAAGDKNHRIGEYNEAIIFNDDRVEKWRKKRFVVNQDDCLNCPACFICGGNCSWSVLNVSKDVKKAMCDDILNSIRFFLQEEGHRIITT